MKKNNPLLVVFLTVFIDMLGVGILIPVLPLLLGEPGSPYYLLPAGFDAGQGYLMLGLLTAIFPLMQFFATPILGQLSDKYGRRKVLLVSLIGTAVGYLLFAYAIVTRNIPLLFFSRALDGITGGNISVAQAAIADVTTPDNRAKNFGLIGAAFGLGFIFGPLIGGKISDPGLVSWFNASTPFLFAALLTVINIISVWFLLPETLKFAEEKPHIKWSKALTNIRKGFLMKEVRLLFLSSFLFQSGFAFFTTFFGVYLIERFAFTQGAIGDFYAVVGICIVITQIVIVRKMASVLKEHQILKFSILATGIGVLLYLIPSVPWQLYLITPFFAAFNGLTQANLGGLVSRSVDARIQGEILGINSSLQALANTIPPVLASLVAASFSPAASIWVAGGVMVIGALIFMIFYRKPAEVGHLA